MSLFGLAGGITKSLGLHAYYALGWSKSTVGADGTTDTVMHNEAKGTNDTAGTGRTLQVENTNKSIEELLQRVEEQLNRVREGKDCGAYSCGAYFLSGKQDRSLLTARLAAMDGGLPKISSENTRDSTTKHENQSNYKLYTFVGLFYFHSKEKAAAMQCPRRWGYPDWGREDAWRHGAG